MLLPECKIEPVTFSTSLASGDASCKVSAKGLNSIRRATDPEENSKCDKEGFKLLENNVDLVPKKCDQIQNTGYAQDTKAAETSDGSVIQPRLEINSKIINSHSRQSSDSCYTSSSSTFSDNSQNKNKANNLVIGELGNCLQGNIVGLHRKMVSTILNPNNTW